MPGRNTTNERSPVVCERLRGSFWLGALGEVAGGRGAARPPQAGPRAKLVAFGGAERGCAPFGARAAGTAGWAKAGCFVIFWGLGLRGRGRKGLGKSGDLSGRRGRGSESSGRGKHWGKAGGRGAARPPAGRAHERSSWLSAEPKGAAPRLAPGGRKKPPSGEDGDRAGWCGGTGV